MRFNVLFVFVFFISCAEVPKQNSVILQTPAPQKELKTEIPNAFWVKIYFDGIDEKDNSGINKIVANDGLNKLSETVLPENDLEIRVWVGFGKYGNDGFILRKISGNWSAIVLKRMLCHLENKGKIELSEPKSGWEAVWQKLLDAGVLTLPDSSKLKSRNYVIDGKSFVVETNYNYLYRTYEYSQPDEQKGNEAKQMVKIGQIIAEEFGLESFSLETSGCKKDE